MRATCRSWNRFENHCQTSGTTPASNDVTALAIADLSYHTNVKDFDQLLQSGLATSNNRVSCAKKSSVLSKVNLGKYYLAKPLVLGRARLEHLEN